MRQRISHNDLNQYGNETIPATGMQVGDLFTDGTNWWCRVEHPIATNNHVAYGWLRIDPDRPYIHPDGTWWVRDARTNVWNPKPAEPSPEHYGDF